MVKTLKNIISIYLSAIVILVSCFATQAEARLIAIVFDSSGSMNGNIHLPTFGAQFIVSTLDGSNQLEPDRFLYGIMGSGQPKFAPMTSRSVQQKRIQRIQREFPGAPGNSDVAMIGLMLDKIVASQKEGEEAFLIVITDGLFSINNSNKFLRQISSAAKNAKGPIRSEFILINSSNSNEFVKNSFDQGVFPLLNTTFNGDPNDGFHNVVGYDAMFATVKGIAARISNTEQVGVAKNIQISGDTMTLESPFSISRILAVSTNDTGGSAPKVVSTSFTATDSFSFTSAMDRPDSAPGWERKMSGITEHFLFTPALSPGIHTLKFDQSLGKNAFLLFEADAVVNLELFDSNGSKVLPGPDGVIEVAKNEQYQLTAQVFNQTSAGNPVPFSKLDSGAGFTTDVSAPSGRKPSIPMVRNDPSDQAEGKYTFSELGEYNLFSILSWPGFVSPTSKILKVHVLDQKAELNITVKPHTSNPAKDILFDVAPTGTRVPLSVAEIVTQDAANKATAYTIKLVGAPDWATIRDTSGTIVPPTQVIKMGAKLLLYADGSMIINGNQLKKWQFKIEVNAASPAHGIAELQVSLLPQVAPVLVKQAGHRKDPTGQTPMPLNGAELLQNKNPRTGGINGLDFIIRDSLETPEAGKNVKVIANAPFGLALPAVVTGNSVTVTPTVSWWCPCVLYFHDGPIQIQIEYDDGNGLQVSRSDVQTLIINITPKEALFSCGIIIAIILLILYLLKALKNGLATNRFPKRSIAEVEDCSDDGAQISTKLHLRGVNYTFFKVLLWPIFGIPNERTTVQGLSLEARRGGCFLLIDESNLGYISDTFDDLREFHEDNPKTEKLRIGWLEEFKRSDDFPEIIRLLRDVSEARK